MPTTYSPLLLMASLVAPGTLPGDSAPPNIYQLVRVREVFNLAHPDTTRDRMGVLDKRVAGLNDIIIIRVENLEALLRKAKCQPPFAGVDCHPQEIALYLDGRVIRGLKPESGAPTLDEPSVPQGAGAKGAPQPEKYLNGTLRYHLERAPSTSPDRQENEEHWADLLGLGLLRGWSLKRQVEVSVGLAGDYPVATDVTRSVTGDLAFRLVRVRTSGLVAWIVGMVILIGILWRLAIQSDILRDRAPVLWGQRKPYSLSAFQAAWWMFLIVSSFAFIWIVTGQYDLSGTALVLLGIGLGTGLGATLIDSNKKNETADAETSLHELNGLLSEKQALEKQLNALQGKLKKLLSDLQGKEDAELDPALVKARADLAKAKAEYAQKIAGIQQKFPSAIGPAGERFLQDILSDAGGVTFHRFQMFVWTIVLGVVFVATVLGRLAMPQFSETLLALMGISAGTYLGFKIPENNSVATKAP